MKTLFFLACVVVALAAVSCDKSKDCSCTVTRTSPESSQPVVTTTYFHIKSGKCGELNTTHTTTQSGFDAEEITITSTSACEKIK